MATETLPEVSKASSVSLATAPEQAVVLSVDWDQYVALRDNPENRHRRMTFDQGVLEIMTLSKFHELVSFLIHNSITAWVLHHRIPCCPTGSLTLRREALDRGLEGDQSYYIEHEPAVRTLEEIDLASDPPPDLAVEVDHTSSSISKMPIYASLGVPEIWRWTKEELHVYRLSDGEYSKVAESSALKGFPLDQLRAALARRHQVDATTLVADFQESLQKQR